MPKEGSMRDRNARREAGHGSAQEDHHEDVGSSEERGAERSATKRSRGSDDSKTPGRKLTKRQQETLDRDRAVMIDDEMGDMEPDGDTGTLEEDRRAAAKKPRRDTKKDEVFFEYRGKRFASQEDLEDYLDDLEIDRRAAQQRGQEPPRQPIPRQEARTEIPWDKLIEDTPGVMNAFGNMILQTIRNELIPAYQADREMNNFWATFYQENPDLAKPKLKMLVENIFMSNQDKLGPLPLDRARARLARIVKADLREIGVTLQGGGQGYVEEEDERPRRGRTIVEGADAGGTGRRGTRHEEDSTLRQQNGNPVTVSSILKARAARRRGEDTSSFFK